ncbi:MAG TPA: hypothetical protein VMF58_14490 [Rhizomicrobium sp.]|nr:hypothetical protein [Rhizomicrobium sp.]
MRTIACALSVSLFATSALAAADYDKTEKTKAYEIRLRIAAPAVAIPKLRDEIMARFQKETAEIKEDSTSDLKEMPQYFHPYAFDANWKVTFENAHLISLSTNTFIDQNGAHPNGEFDSIVWDKQASRVVPLHELFAPGKAPAAFKAIASAARKAWQKSVVEKAGGDADTSDMDQGIGADEKHLGHYALTYAKGDTKANGIVLLYGPGEVWVHVLGDFRLSIPVAVFRDYLTPAWRAEFK